MLLIGVINNNSNNTNKLGVNSGFTGEAWLAGCPSVSLPVVLEENRWDEWFITN